MPTRLSTGPARSLPRTPAIWDDRRIAGDDELGRTVRKLAIDHAETRWLSLRLDDDVKEIRQELRAMRTDHAERFDTVDGRFDSVDGRFDAVDRELQAHAGRFDSTDAVLRSLHQMVGQVLERLPEEPERS